MLKKSLAILAAVVISVGSIGGGAYWLGNTAYNDGIKAGISAVVAQCAEHDSTIYNGITGDVMVCSGGHVTQGQKAPEKALPEPPEDIAGTPGRSSIPDSVKEKPRTDNI